MSLSSGLHIAPPCWVYAAVECTLDAVIASDGYDKPFCTTAITIIDNFKNALGDINKSQFRKAISAIDELSPIDFSDKCCGKFLTCWTKFFSCTSNHGSVFPDFSRKESSSRTLPWD